MEAGSALDPQPLGRIRVAGLDAIKRFEPVIRSIVVPLVGNAGGQTLRVRVDAGGAIDEIYELNNVLESQPEG